MTDRAPLVRLQEADRAALERHFLALGREDRRLRFGAAIGNAGVRTYVARIDFERDAAFAIPCGDELVAVLHVAFTDEIAELGLSVAEGWRLRGFGNRLFDYAVAFAGGQGASELFVHCRSENGAMMHLARKHQMRIANDGDESDARVALGRLTRPGATAP